MPRMQTELHAQLHAEGPREGLRQTGEAPPQIGLSRGFNAAEAPHVSNLHVVQIGGIA
jgi:hypothetical protein